MSINELLDNVKDESTFLEFVKALKEDFNVHRSEWENGTIDQFLESAIAWSEDSNFGSDQGLKDASAWKKIAVFLYSGKIYE
jgi:hypothetical protein